MFQGKLLLVASTGGHLSQLVRMVAKADLEEPPVWVTFRSPQSESLLSGEKVIYVPYIAPRDIVGVWKARRLLNRVLREHSFDYVISTGAAIALAAFTSDVARAASRIYIESVSRTEGPSLTGKIVQVLRLGDLYTQHSSWANKRWKLTKGVLDEYECVADLRPPVESPKLFVTLGTIRPYRFDSLVDAILATGLADDRTVWQTGVTNRDGLPGTVVEQVSTDQLRAFAAQADVVVTHAGVGSILELLDLGINPVVIPRVAERDEHVDDHQKYICALLESKKIGIVSTSDKLDARTIIEASRTGVVAK